MRARGFSLVEMVVAIGIISVLLAIGTLRFSDYLKRYRTEAQTRLLYSELLRAQANAICQRRAIRVKLYPGRFEVYSSVRDDADGVRPVQAQTLSYPVACNASTGNAALGYPLQFEANGLTSPWCSICLDPSAGSGVVDSIKIAPNRVSIGKKDKGEECKGENITIK